MWMLVAVYNENDEIVQKCAPGSTLELVLYAQYQGWSNFAKYGQITIYYWKWLQQTVVM